jgi:hypothetical protein
MMTGIAGGTDRAAVGLPSAALTRRRALWLLAGLPAACTSPNPTLYTLAMVPGVVRSGAPARIELRAVALARYLERSQIVRSSEDFRLDVLGNDWWGEPLDAMLNRVLVQALSQRLPASTVFAENGAITATPDASLELNIQRFDEDRSGAVLLEAQVAVTGAANGARNVRLTVMPPTAGTPGLVSAMSTATGQLADIMAAMLVVPAAPAVAPPPRGRPGRGLG